MPRVLTVPTQARSGRELQKYGESGERLVAGSIPVRFKEGVEGPDGVEVLLISSNSGKRPVFPKGGWEQDEELREAALRETLEEAGVRGTLEEPLIGKFPFLSAKAPAQHTQMTHGGRCMAYLFVMHVSEVLEVWPEAKQRKREWCSLQEACRRCRYDWMREALIVWMRRQGWEDAAFSACQLQCSDTDSNEDCQPAQLGAVMATGAPHVPDVAVAAACERVAVST
ncbi:Nudix hydrolase 21 [Chlorella vulgaris]